MPFILTSKNTPYTAKDQEKANIATKYIGFSVLGKNRATELYYLDALAQNIPVNIGSYSKDDVVFVSINGKGYGCLENFNKTITEITIALQNSATIIIDNTEHAQRTYNNFEFGEQGIRNYLKSKYPSINVKEEKYFSRWFF